VPEQVEVYTADLAAARERPEEQQLERSNRDYAVDGVAHHVFNTLRGVEDTVDGATFKDVRALVAEAF
jgi:hypothetical protein